jgi:hypothetical protein
MGGSVRIAQSVAGNAGVAVDSAVLGFDEPADPGQLRR